MGRHDLALSGATPPIFISYRRADVRWARFLHRQLKDCGVEAWYDANVGAGEDWRAATAKALEGSRIFVLLFSSSAAESTDIAKELAAATLEKKLIVPVRLENIAPKGPFLYELASRNWVDAFDNTEDALTGLAKNLADWVRSEPANDSAIPFDRAARQPQTSEPPIEILPAFSSKRWVMIAATCLIALIAAGASWNYLRPAAPNHAITAAHSMAVRLAKFQLLSDDLPAAFQDAVEAEITAAFNIDGVVGVSTSESLAPTYTLGGSIQRDGSSIRVITNLINERSGAALWSSTFDYPGDEVSKVPRRIAVDAGNVIRCGLFGASTYHAPLPDPILRDYLKFCQGHWDPNMAEGRKALVPAQRVVDALPDFSWGWAAVAGAYWKVAAAADNAALSDKARASGREASDRAIAIDGKNSEALYLKAVLLDERDWIGREKLFKRAVSARRLDCGCEYHQYGWMLVKVGRTGEAVEYLQKADDMLSLYVYTPLTLADALVVAGRLDEAKSYYDAAIEIAPDADFEKWLQARMASHIGDINLLRDPSLPIGEKRRAALLKGFEALASQATEAKEAAIRDLLALNEDEQRDDVAKLLASLGADHEAFKVAARTATKDYFSGPAVFWDKRMRRVLDDPEFPAVAERLGLTEYWRETGERPDVCREDAAPAFCDEI